MPTPIELLTAAQAKLAGSQSDLAAANSKITDANALIDQAKAGITPVPPPTLYTLIVVSGSGSGNYAAGSIVPVVANPTVVGREFAGWTGPVADPSKPSTTVTMPTMGVQVEATYRTVPVPPTPGTRVVSLVHLGSFKVPNVSGDDMKSYAYANAVMGFCAAHNSLFMGGFVRAHTIGEISIPAFGATAQSIQNPVDPFGGKIEQINPSSPNQKNVGGIFVDGDTLVVSAYDSYDGSATQQLSHFRRPLTLSTPPETVVGPYAPGGFGAGFVAGYMGAVPPAWQAKFRGRAFTGQCCIAIISHSSYGPSTTAFDPSVVTQSAVELVAYPDTHQTLGAWGAKPPGQYFGGSDTISGIAMPDAFASVLFFGRHGTTFCYGGGTSQQPPPSGMCYDPTNSDKGSHGYPYLPSCWGFDANDLASAAAGTKAPWDIKPYVIFTVPGMQPNAKIGGAAYDPATGRIYLAELYADNGILPIIHVYEARG